MKITHLAVGKNPVEYAQEHNLEIRKYITVSRFPQIVPMFYFCMQKAEQEGCIEIIFDEVADQFNLMEDQHNWKLSIYGFILKN